MNKVLVTGANGFIGSHLTERLLSLGYDVRAFVEYNSFNSSGWLDYLNKDLKNEIDFFHGDIRDPNGVSRAVKDCETVFHLAALIGIPYSYYSPDTYIDTNIKGTLNILQAGRRHNVSKIIHTSTSEVYGSAEFIPITEEHPIIGQSPYSASKIGADNLAISFYKSFETPVAILRPFNTYGPRQSERAIIPTIINQILNDKDNLKLGSVSPTRDFSYISDTVEGFIAQLKTDKGIGEIINIGSGFEISINDTVNIIKSLMSSSVRVVEEKSRVRPKKSEVNRLYACNKKAKKILKWEPQYNDIEGFKKGIKKTIEWFSSSENKSKYITGKYII